MKFGMPNTLFGWTAPHGMPWWRWAAGPGEEKLISAARPCKSYHQIMGNHLEQLGTRENILKSRNGDMVPARRTVRR